MASALLFVYGSLTLFTAVNGLRRPSPPTSRFPPLWLPAMLIGEAPYLFLIGRTLIAGILVVSGGLALPMGSLGLTSVGIAQLLQLEVIRRGLMAAQRAQVRPVAVSWWERLTSWPFHLPPGVERLDDIEYAPGFRTDLYRSRSGSSPDRQRPTLIYVHGGSWGGGDPRRQFRTITHHLAAEGWVMVTIRYPFSPAATFPEHLVAVNRAIHWARTEGMAYGIDPQRIAIAGGSAGAHLAALAALSNGNHQPGFEDADTSVAAAVVLYGIYDFFNRNRVRYDWPVIPKRVMKAPPAEAEELYRQASPIDQVHPGSPPFLVVHGTHDSLVPPGESVHFVEALQRAGASAEYLPVYGAQHAFDVLGGIRTRVLAGQIKAFLDQSFSTRHHPPTEGIMET